MNITGSASADATADKRRALLDKLMSERGMVRPTIDGVAPAPLRIPRRAAGQMRVPQSFAQQRLWFLDRLAPGNPFYTVSLATPIASAVDRRALQRALDEIVSRHEALRTTFSEADGLTLQLISPPATAALEFIDLGALCATERAAEVERLTEAEMQRSFDLERGPLMVTKLLRLSPSEHRLLLTLHHIVCDGWSLRVLAQELFAAYRAFALQQTPDLPELPIQYADFALWQRDQMAGAEFDRQLAYWRGALAGASELRLLSDRTRPAIPSFRGGLVPLVIGPGDAQAVARLAAETESTPFVVLMAAFMALLSRLTAQDDIVVGTPIANRTRAELEPLIGFFVNTLVLRLSLADQPSFRTLVGRMRQVAFDAYANQDLPFERLVEALAPERVLGRNPLFQVIFQLFSAHDGVAGGATPATRQRGTAKFDLRLDLWPTPENGYAGELEYSADVLERASAERIAAQFGTLLRALLDAPDQCVADAEAMDANERRRVVEDYNATARPFPVDTGVHHLFSTIAASYPQHVALCFADAQLSYAALDAASDRMAYRLASRGVGAGDTVGVLLERSAAMIVAWLAALKLGAAYVPLDIAQPPARLATMLLDANCRAVVCQAAQLALLHGSAVAIERADVDREAPPVPFPRVDGESVAHIIFTSGSTGRPKGVMIPHRGIARLVRGIDWNDFGAGERVAQTSNPAFDASTYEVWAALLNGCTLVEIDRETTLDAAALEHRLSAEKIDHLFLTTALFTRLAADRPGMFARLKSLMTGGAKAEVASFRAVLAAGAPARLFNAYGPTETTVLGSIWTATSLPADALTVPIGRPVSNTTCYVLDERRRPVPLGAPGQLHIGGPGVALGYCAQPELSAERFLPDPFYPGAATYAMYATGDQARWRYDGQLEFLGRFDDQIKIRGFRVEPGEIAAVLSTFPAVRSAVVVARQREGDGEADHSLCAYIELHDDLGASFDAAAVLGSADDLVAHWRSLYDTVLYDSPVADPAFNTSGWNDSATGAPIAGPDMAEQVAQTVDRARQSLDGTPRRVLEVGCGTGLLLFRLAPGCGRYVGTDLSASAIEHVRRTASTRPGFEHLELLTGAATDLSGVAAGDFDLILLNSVVQYFPSFDYLRQVARACSERLAPGGVLMLGDLRHQGLLHAFHADVLVRRAADSASVETLRSELRRRLDEEQELALAPAAVSRLAAEVNGFDVPRIELKRGAHQNELNRFRYDAFLTWQPTVRATLKPIAQHWVHDLHMNWPALRSAVEAQANGAIRIVGIPNARIEQAERGARLIDAAADIDVAALRRRLDTAAPVAALDPETLWRLGDEIGRPVRVLWNTLDDAAFDAVFLPPGAKSLAVDEWPDPRATRALSELVTTPLRGHFVRQLVPSLKAHLAARLPQYMVPDYYVRLTHLPLSANGKVDHSALPAIERLRPELREAHVMAQSATEQRLADLWGRLLGVVTPGVTAHFFNDLGGHSLLATQVMSRVRSEFGVELPLRLIFEGPTIAELARAIDAACAADPSPASAAPIAATLDAQDVDALDEAALDAALARLAAEDARR